MNSKPHILIVDDNPDNIQVAANILSDQGYEISVVRDGKTALKLLQSADIDLVLLDIMMPELDGFQVCDLLKSDPASSDIPVIFLTAKTETDSIVKGFEVGGIDYVTKPFNAAELLVRVKTHMELRRAKKLLEAANQQLTELNGTKDKLFSVIAHDLRDPFNALIGASEYLLFSLETLEKKDMKEMVQIINGTSKQAYTLLENLLEWSRIQTGRLCFEPERVNISEMVLSAVQLLDQNAKGKKIRISSTVPPHLTAYADPNMTETLIRNLLNNAVKFTQEGGEIRIDAVQREDMIEISVADNGVGIPENQMEELFSMASKHVTAGTNQEKGTGLGLILCREFAERNRGKIWVRSEVGRGSRFIFTLPEEKAHGFAKDVSETPDISS